ncbi:MAG TPA: VCBS repeat-containing protein [Planctomycetota bacterium]|nr:VCBS repeat-containing protein [Planctomycetota bacterium]
MFTFKRGRVLLLSSLASTVLLCSSASAQFDVKWVTFKDSPTKLGVLPTAISDTSTEVDFATGDLNNDGWQDVVAVRKQQTSTTGKRTNMLLINNHGKLEDKTAQWATAADVAGDLGFLTPVNNRDAKIIDVNNDGWADVVTCTTLSDGDPKVISHPRVYMNLGDDGTGQWLGLRFENARFPQLLTIPGGLAVAPRFCEVAAGDVSGDGFADLYFSDYDGTETGIPEAGGEDLNDRLLFNDGNGFFVDTGVSACSASELNSAFGVKAEILDLNGDARNDIVKLSTLGGTGTNAMYNQPLGSFSALGLNHLGSGSPYGFDMGSLNGDGLPDVAGADDGLDVYQLSTGFDALNRLTWGPVKTYQFASGGDDGFGHNVYIRDLNADGWGDVMISSVDVDVSGCGGRWHIYHNLGGVVGGDVTLKEEMQSGGSTGWKGAVGITATDLAAGYDAAYADFDHDNDLDMIVSGCGGAKYFQNQTAPATCQEDLGFAGPGTTALSICGEDLTQTASTATLSVTGAAPSSPMFIALGLVNNPTPLKGGTLVPVPLLLLLGGFNTTASGTFDMPVAGGSATPGTIYIQVVVKHGTTLEFSNALALNIGL